MVSATASISVKDFAGPESASISGNRARVGSVAREGRQDPRATFDIMAMTEAFNQKLKMIHNVDLHFSVHEGSGQILVKVMNAGTDEVIREIPPSEMLDLAARLDEMIGLIFDRVG